MQAGPVFFLSTGFSKTNVVRSRVYGQIETNVSRTLHSWGGEMGEMAQDGGSGGLDWAGSGTGRIGWVHL